MVEDAVPGFLISRVAAHESACTTSGCIEARERQLRQTVDIFSDWANPPNCPETDPRTGVNAVLSAAVHARGQELRWVDKR